MFLVSGWAPEGSSLADALAIGPVAGKLKQPILLTQSKSLSKPTRDALKQMEVKNITIIGGEQPVSKHIENELKQSYNVKRISGSNRENTAIEIKKNYFTNDDKVIIANGYSSIDALLGGYLGSKNNISILFSNKDKMQQSTQDYLYNSNIKSGYLLGGEVVINDEVKELAMNKIMKINKSNAKKPINIETPKPYASLSGQTTHPDVVYLEKGWNGHKYWMAHTPYHDTNEDLENPSVSYSDDGINFKTYKGAKNPIDDPKFGLVDERAHMSDTDLLIKPDGTMEVYYRYRDRAKGKGETIYRKTSKDAINWTDREIVMEGFNDAGVNLLSPALIYENNSYKMWWVENTTVYTSTSKTALNGTWSPKQKVNLKFAGKQMNPWHLDVFKDNGKYYILLNVNETDVKSQRLLTIGESNDGLNFNNIKTIMKPTVSNWDNRDIYRGSIVNVNGTYKLYYSAMGKDRRWFVGLSESNDLTHWLGK